MRNIPLSPLVHSFLLHISRIQVEINVCIIIIKNVRFLLYVSSTDMQQEAQIILKVIFILKDKYVLNGLNVLKVI